MNSTNTVYLCLHSGRLLHAAGRAFSTRKNSKAACKLIQPGHFFSIIRMCYKTTFPTDTSHAYGSRKRRNSRRAASPPAESFGREGVGFGEGKGTLFQRLCYSLWLFHLHSAVKIQPFSPVFPLAGSTAKAFFRLSLWNFKEKSTNRFL